MEIEIACVIIGVMVADTGQLRFPPNIENIEITTISETNKKCFQQNISNYKKKQCIPVGCVPPACA